MLSHTVPRKLLDQFAYDDPVTRSRRLWAYQKGRLPSGRAAPRTATRWDGHFADPANATKEAQIELRLKREFEDPVNQFLDLLACETFVFHQMHQRLLTGYVTMLFHRSHARQAAGSTQQDRMVAALQSLRGNEERLGQLAAKQTMDLLATGVDHVFTTEEAITVIDEVIKEQTTVDAAQQHYVETMETMMGFVDERMRDGGWHIVRTDAAHPFVIGDAPVVTWERTDQGALILGQGFGRPNVEVFLPVFPTACLHILPAVQRTRRVVRPAVDEVNRAEAAFATHYCYANIKNKATDAVLQPAFCTVRLGIEGFNIDHIDTAAKLFEILMTSWRPRERYADR